MDSVDYDADDEETGYRINNDQLLAANAGFLNVDPRQICQEIEYLLGTRLQLPIIDERHTSYPWLLDCIPMESGGDLLGLTAAIMIQQQHKLDRHSLVKFVERAAIAGKLELLYTVLLSRQIDPRFFQPALMQALLNRQLASAVVLREHGVPFDAMRYFCPEIRENFPSALELVQVGLVSVAEVHSCIKEMQAAYAADGDDEDGSVDEQRQLIELLNERESAVASNDIASSVDSYDNPLGLFRHFIRFSDSYDPLMFACRTGDTLLLMQLELSSNPQQFPNSPSEESAAHESPNPSVQRRLNAKASIAELIRTEGIHFPNDQYKYLAEAIKQRHNNIVSRLLKWFQYSPHQLKMALTLADSLHNNEAKDVLYQLGDFGDSADKKYQMRKLISAAKTVREVRQALDSGLPLPRLAYLDAARTANPKLSFELCQLIFEFESKNNGYDATQSRGGAVEAMEWLVTQKDLDSFDVLMFLLEKHSLTPEKLERIVQQMVLHQNFGYLRWSLLKHQFEGLDLEKMIRFNLLAGLEEAAKIFADYLNDSFLLFRVYEQLPVDFVEARRQLLDRVLHRITRKLW
jgi:hypothetical protein